ncbi:BPG-independent PGAM domain protein [candidate division TM7 genomosp. GTL1]|nr:BPG-independent PGAM domain protein [candidate division TM7 genomosp. GTL1]
MNAGGIYSLLGRRINNMVKKPFVLIICDGWGEAPEDVGNAIAAASTPNLDKLRAKWPHTTVAASGEAVGLPAGQQGNSEVGHLTIGSGRIIRQPLSRQHHAIESGVFF